MSKIGYLPSALVIAGTSMALLSLTACSTSDGGAIEYREDKAPSSTGLDQSDMAMVEMADAAAPVPSGESVITTGSATIRTNTPESAAKDFAAKITDMDGIITSTWQSEWDGSVSATVDAQVPADRYQELVASLSDFGKIVDQNTSRQDVGLQVTDLNARKEALETSLIRLQELMEQATTTEELLQAEDMLTQRQAELDSLNSQLEWLTNQVDMSSIYVTFTEDSSAGSGFSWDRAWDLLIGSLKFVAYALVVLVPWLIIVGLIVWLIRALVRRGRRSKLGSVAEIVVEDEKSEDTAPLEEKHEAAEKHEAVRAAPEESDEPTTLESEEDGENPA
ncbi:MAG: DUF4349 domain-containing protein [Scrofimicrobium sp.]